MVDRIDIQKNKVDKDYGTGNEMDMVGRNESNQINRFFLTYG